MWHMCAVSHASNNHQDLYHIIQGHVEFSPALLFSDAHLTCKKTLKLGAYGLIIKQIYKFVKA